jgi:uncharacterized membrane protein YphA (DoxX/SURF4 family)
MHTPFRRTDYWFRAGVGVLLLASAALKCRQLSDASFAEQGILTTRLFWICVVEMELVLGLWLLSNLYARFATICAMICFAAYFEFSLTFAGSGLKSCSCFGSFQFSPRSMAVLDLVAFFALLICRPVRPDAATWRTHPGRCLAIAALLVISGASAVVVIHRYHSETSPYALRPDMRLGVSMDLESSSASQDFVLARLAHVTGLEFKADPELSDNGVDLGEVHLSRVNAWAVMEWLRQEQPQAADWQEVDSGYLLKKAPAWRLFSPLAVLVFDLSALVAAALWCCLYEVFLVKKLAASMADAEREPSTAAV